MRKAENIDKNTVARIMVKKLEQENKPSEIKTSYLKGYPVPDKIAFKGNNDAHIPDIEAIFNDAHNLYEIELDDIIKVDKWKLLSLYAKINSGRFYLVVPRWLKEPIIDEIKKEKIRARVISFS